jgi:hypothetical protein
MVALRDFVFNRLKLKIARADGNQRKRSRKIMGVPAFGKNGASLRPVDPVKVDAENATPETTSALTSSSMRQPLPLSAREVFGAFRLDEIYPILVVRTFSLSISKVMKTFYTIRFRVVKYPESGKLVEMVSGLPL